MPRGCFFIYGHRDSPVKEGPSHDPRWIPTSRDNVSPKPSSFFVLLLLFFLRLRNAARRTLARSSQCPRDRLYLAFVLVSPWSIVSDRLLIFSVDAPGRASVAALTGCGTGPPPSGLLGLRISLYHPERPSP